MSKNTTKVTVYQKKKRADNIAGYMFLLPAIISFILFIGGPMILSFIISFFDYNLIQAPEFIGIKNLRRFSIDPQVKISYINTFKFLFILVPIHCFGGLILAFFGSLC